MVGWVDGLLLILAAGAVLCVSGTTLNMDVATPVDLERFIEAMEGNDTTTNGIYNITWYGRQQVHERIEISDTKDVTITGVTRLGTDPAAANDAGSSSTTGGLFFVDGGSTLTLRSLVLDGGQSQEGGAISAMDGSVVNVFDCAFTNNNASNGGAIYANGSKVNIDGETSFVNNSATSDVEVNTGGGAIYATHSEVKIQGQTCFVNNFAVVDGGAILLNDGAEVILNGSTNFFNNHAGDDGGAIASKAETRVHVEGSTNFTSNFAFNNGGAIAAVQTGIRFYGSTHFTGNAAANNGGAVYILWGPALYVYGSGTYFADNSALIGGAFFARDATVNIDGRTSFVNNSATGTAKDTTGGGAIYAKNSSVNTDGRTSFINNSASFDGGAILLFAGSEVYINGGTVFFDNQAGHNGGAIKAEHSDVQVDGSARFTGNTADGSGGAVYADNSSVVIDGDAGFADNRSFLDGGAVQIVGGPGLYISGVGAVFTNNSAKVGGAIHTTSCSLGIDGNITFANNSAVECGGAVYSLEDDPVALSGNLSFVNNSAGTGGGALAIGDPGGLSIVGANFTRNRANIGGAVSATAVQNREREYRECRFEYNKATADGGAIHFVTGGGSDNVTSSTFRGNYAADSGGAVYQTEALIRVSTTFRENTAGEKGLTVRSLVFDGGQSQEEGAIYAMDGSVVDVFDCAFTNNNASNGGAIYSNGSKVNIDGKTSFVNNSATSDFKVNTGGGAMYATNSELKIDGETCFINNFAVVDGGAVLLNDGSEVLLDGSTAFFNNHAGDDGGAIASKAETRIHLEGSTNFTSNFASNNGGAIAAFQTSIQMRSNTHFTGNAAANNGGAVYILWGPALYINGSGTYFTKNSALIGGCLFARDATVNIDGQTSFVDNSATSTTKQSSGGGAIYAKNSTVNNGGNTIFVNNSASFGGGAILLFSGSGVYINGGAEFFNNQAGYNGGAIKAEHSDVVVDGSARFKGNSADGSGGAVYADNSSVTIDGDTGFIENLAFLDGGAVRIIGGPGLYIYGVGAVFTSNSAKVGGAIHSTSSSLGIDGNVTFANNSAVEFGGAVYSLQDDPVALPGNLSFVNNSAGTGGGALSIGDPGELIIVGATFTQNRANVGGAVSVTAVQNREREYRACRFEGNKATADGGAIYFVTGGGSDNVTASVFRGNYAANSGGAVYHREALVLVRTTFRENTAGEKGFAVLASTAVALDEVSFVDNTFHCARGQYLCEDVTETASSKTRFELACAQCSTPGSRSNPEGVQVQHENEIPSCEDLPTGAKAASSGTTVEGITLEAGYYRTSSESRDILECHRQRACVGGDGANSYCAVGYEGPYCAVCAEGFAPLASYNCRDCSATDRRSQVGLVAAVVTAFILVAAALSAHLMRAIDDSGDGDVDVGEEQMEIARRGSIGKRSVAVENVFVKVFPLTAFKTVVVVWQIVSQFAAIAGDVYPEEYATFVDKLSLINLDIGVIMSYSCLVSTDFYDSLLLSTISPLVALLALACTYSVAKRRNNVSEAAMREVQHKHLSAGLFVGFLVYSSVSFTIFQTFVCETLDDGVPYLRADYNTTCDTTTYAKYRAYAILMVCVYPIGLPAILSWWLLRNRVDLRKENRTAMVHLVPFSGVWAPYKPSRYYYEVVECGRRISLTATASFVPPNSVTQIAVVLLVAAVLLFVSESMSPFSSSVDMGLYRWGNGIILASMYVALLLKVDISSDQSSTYAAFGTVLIAANVFLVVTVAVQSVLMVFEWQGVKRSAGLVPPPTLQRQTPEEIQSECSSCDRDLSGLVPRRALL